MTVLFFGLLLLFGLDLRDSIQIVLRLLVLLIPLGVLQGLYSLLFFVGSCAMGNDQLFDFAFWEAVFNFRGVFAPVSDFSEPARSILLQMPTSDIFFQPAYYCIKGVFYNMSTGEWILRVAAQILVLMILEYSFL